MTQTDDPLPEQWWEHASGAVRFYPKADGVPLSEITAQLDDVADWGFDAVEVFAPYHGGTEYSGLDVRDYYAVDPAIGTVADFEALVAAAHERGLAVMVFLNMGYCAEDAPFFREACDAVREGRDADVADWFLWSEDGDDEVVPADPPWFAGGTDGRWVYSDRAAAHYWVKWEGAEGGAALPQFDFGDPGWRAECADALRFWLDFGIDGVVVDAVNWYANCDWAKNRETTTGVVDEYDNVYVQPEGAGGFEDDPVRWIEEGGYDSVQDYAVNLWWTGHDVVADARAAGDASLVEDALAGYRDRVVAAGGVTYIGPVEQAEREPVERSVPARLLELAVLVAAGEFVVDEGDHVRNRDWDDPDLEAQRALLCLLQSTPPLQAASDRERRPTADEALLALERTSADGDRVLAVCNVADRPASATVSFDAPVRATPLLATGDRAVRTGEAGTVTGALDLDLDPVGYRFLALRAA